MSRWSDDPPERSATGASQRGRHVKLYRHTARVPPPSGSAVNRQPPAMTAKNHGPSTIFMPTFVGGWYETYSLTIRSPDRCRVRVRTPLAGAVSPSRNACRRMNGSQRSRVSPVVCETANATSGGTGTTTDDSTITGGTGSFAVVCTAAPYA